MFSLDLETSAPAHETTQREQRARAATDVRCDRSADDAEFWKWSNTEDQTWTKQDVDRIRQPQCAHRDRRITRAAKDRIDHEQHHDGRIAGKHYARECRTVFDYPRRATHQREQFRCVR